MFKRCIIFLADGARPDVLSASMRRGNLPNLSRYLAEKGTHRTILSTFPSTTGPAYLPFLTGSYPGTCNIPGIRWFDKAHYAKHGWSLKSFRSYVGLETLLFGRDMRREVKTIFPFFKKPASIFNMVNRDLKKGENKTRHSRIWYLYYAHLTDRFDFVDEAATRKLLDSLNKGCDFAFAVFPGIDEFSHRSSPFHPRSVKAYADVDRLIGKVIDLLKKKGWLGETLLALVSDHGLSETAVHFDVGPYLEEKGIKTLFYTQIFKRNIGAAVMVSGNGMAHLYFKGDKGWGARATFEDLSSKGLLLDELRMRPEIGLVASQGADGAIHLQTERGHGFFSSENGMIEYQWDFRDPLGLFPDNDSQKASFSADESLVKTFDSQFPDVFVQLKQIFSSPRAGDVILSAKTGCDLRKRYEIPEHKSTHGAFCPEQMRIPFLINTPLSTKNPIRSVDVFPTILKLTGKEIPDGIDGISLV